MSQTRNAFRARIAKLLPQAERGQLGGGPLLDGGGGGGRGGTAGRLEHGHDGAWAAAGRALRLALAGSRPRLISCI